MTPLDSNSYSENGISPRTLVPKPQSDFCSQLIRSKFRYQTWARKLKHYIPPLHSRKMLCFSPNLRMTVSPLFTNQGNRHGKAGNQSDMLSVFTLLGWCDPGNVTWYACVCHSNTALNNSYGWELDIVLGQWISCTSFQPSRSSNRYGKTQPNAGLMT